MHHQPLKSRNKAHPTMILAKTSQQRCWNLIGRFTVRRHRKETTIVVPRKKAARRLRISLSERHRATQTTIKWKRHQIQTKKCHSRKSSFRNSCCQIYKGHLLTEVLLILVNHQVIDLWKTPWPTSKWGTWTRRLRTHRSSPSCKRLTDLMHLTRTVSVRNCQWSRCPSPLWSQMRHRTSLAIVGVPAASSSTVTVLGQVSCAQISASATDAKIESLMSRETNFWT